MSEENTKKYTYDMQPNFSRVGVKFLGQPKKKDSLIYVPGSSSMFSKGYHPCLITHLGPEAGLRTDTSNNARQIMKLKVGMVVICKREHFINVQMPNGVVYYLVPDDQILSVLTTSEIDENGNIIPEDKIAVHQEDWEERCFRAAKMIISELGVVENVMPGQEFDPNIRKPAPSQLTTGDDPFYSTFA